MKPQCIRAVCTGPLCKGATFAVSPRRVDLRFHLHPEAFATRPARRHDRLSVDACNDTSATPALVIAARIGNHVRRLLGAGLVQRHLKLMFGKILRGPSGKARDATPAYVWGEVSNEAGEVKRARIKTANGYSLTVSGALAVVEYLMQRQVQGGAYTPATLVGPDLVVKLPGSGNLAFY